MAQQQGGLILSSLADRQIFASGAALLANDYKITNLETPSTWTLDAWMELGERASQMEWLASNIDAIRDRLMKVIKGQVTWEKLKMELVKEGFKGASDISKSTVDALISESSFLQKVAQGENKLNSKRKQFGKETEAIQTHEEALCGFALASLKAKHDQIIEEKQAEDPNFAVALAAWQQEQNRDYAFATQALSSGYGTRSHPKFQGMQTNRAIGGSSTTPYNSSFAGSRARQRPVDELNINLKGNVAGAVNGFAGRVGAGARKVVSFFRG